MRKTALALTILAAAPASAGAATVTLTDSAGGAGVAVTALPGEGNHLAFTRGAGATLVVRDPSAPLTPGAGCATTAPGEVTCTALAAPITTLDVDAGDGDDVVDASATSDLIVAIDGGAGDDTLRGGGGPDRLRPGTGRDVVDGGPGIDGVYYDERTALVSVFLDGSATSGVDGEGDVLANIEDAFGGPGDDILIGDARANILSGGAGGDQIVGEEGDDTLDGGDGGDAMAGGAGDDTLVGDAGNDTMNGNGGDDFLAGGRGSDRMYGANGDDTFDLTGDPATTRGEEVTCGPGRDRVDSPAAFEDLSDDCDRVDIAVRGEDVQPLRLLGTPRADHGAVVLRVACAADDCGDRTRARFTVHGAAGRAARATTTLRASQTTTLRIVGLRARRGQPIRLAVAGTQVEGGDGVPVRGGFSTILR